MIGIGLSLWQAALGGDGGGDGGGDPVPVNAIRDDAGNPIRDDAGNYILSES